MKKKEFTATSTTDLDSLSREIIKQFSTDDEIDKRLSDDDSKESRIFNLAIQYLDVELADKKEEIGKKLRELLSE